LLALRQEGELTREHGVLKQNTLLANGASSLTRLFSRQPRFQGEQQIASQTNPGTDQSGQKTA
jgi:hypothetical protein